MNHLGPGTIHFLVEWRCNARCRSCVQHVKRTQQAQSHTAPEHTSLAPEVVSHVLLDYSTVHTVNLSGLGEPLLNPRFEEIVDVVKKHPVSVNCVTNGSLLHARRNDVKELLALPGLLTISCDAPDEQLFERLRPGLSFSDIVTNVAAAVDAERHEGRKIGLGMTISSLNQLQVYEMAKFAGRLGVDYLMLSRARELRRVPSSNRKAATVRELNPGEPEVHAQLPRARQYVTIHNNFDDSQFAKCRAPWDELVVDIDGYCYACCCAYNVHSELPGLGDYREDPYHSARAQELRRQLASGLIDADAFPLCVTCSRRP